MTEIKYTAGDEIYWLSSKGFRKGIVKQVILNDYINIYKGKQVKTKDIKFLAWCDNYGESYMGDEVKADEMFDNYDDMLKHYSELKL